MNTYSQGVKSKFLEFKDKAENILHNAQKRSALLDMRTNVYHKIKKCLIRKAFFNCNVEIKSTRERSFGRAKSLVPFEEHSFFTATAQGPELWSMFTARVSSKKLELT